MQWDQSDRAYILTHGCVHEYFSFNPRAKTRASSRSSAFGLPLLVPPTSFRGPQVFHPLQENSPTTENPRFISSSFTVACLCIPPSPLVEKIKARFPVTAGSASTSWRSVLWNFIKQIPDPNPIRSYAVRVSGCA